MRFGCSKELSQWQVFFEYSQQMFWLRNKKNNFLLRILNWGPVNISQSLVDKSLALNARDLFTLTIDLQPVIY